MAKYVILLMMLLVLTPAVLVEGNIDDCTPNPCQNGGACIDGVESYTCSCADGFEGNQCQSNIDDCTPNPCQNGWACTDGVASYTCSCADGFEGNQCQSCSDLAGTKYCVALLKGGYTCDDDAPWMPYSCRKTCQNCGSNALCKNYNVNCESWANTQRCELNRDYMLVFCYAACTRSCQIAATTATTIPASTRITTPSTDTVTLSDFD